MDDRIGTLIRGYEIIEQIDKGGFATVYRAHQKVLGRDVAIKIIHPEIAEIPEFVKAFDEEAHLVAQLEHFHIVPLYDYWRDDSGAYLVMRWLRGGSLRQAIDREGPGHSKKPASCLTRLHRRWILPIIMD